MPPPDKPCFSGTAGLSADEIDKMDPDYLYFLRHLRPEGRAYAVEIPSKDGSSPPEVVRYEKPLAALNAEASAAGSEPGTRSASSPMAEGSWAGADVPSGAASPPAGGRGEARSGAVPVEADELLSPKEEEPAWYDSMSNMDGDFLSFLQHCSKVNDSHILFEMGKISVTIGEDSAANNCEDVDEEEDEEESEVEEVEAVSASGDNSVGKEEEEEKPVVDGSNWPIVKVSEIEAKVKEEVEDIVVKEEFEEEYTFGSDLQLVNVMEFETKMEVDEDEEQPLNVPVMRSQAPDPSKGESSSSQAHSSMPRNASESGVIWPTHIIERPDSDFKRKLVKVLKKPFNQEEYDEMFSMATDRTPVIKERRTRRRVMYYPWKHEMGKSYFDSHPDLANQFKGENSFPNRLALLRGFFFWLENVGHDKQFRPWRADFRRYRLHIHGFLESELCQTGPYSNLFCIRNLAAVELDTRLAHAEIEVLGQHVVLDNPIVEQLPDVVLEIRANQPKCVL
ncbi:hypothetical protein EJB05_38541, partial [Eragrostis curvula]